MQTFGYIFVRFAGILTLALALGLGACGGDGTEPEEATAATTESCGSDQAAQQPGAQPASDDSACKLAKPVTAAAACKPAGKTCSPARAAECCSLACLCPVGAKKCTCG